MNKLAALSKLASAYNALPSSTQSRYKFDEDDAEAMVMLDYFFGYLRRSLRIADLVVPKDVEGLNGRMPTHF